MYKVDNIYYFYNLSFTLCVAMYVMIYHEYRLNVVVSELNTVWRVMSLPLLEPLNIVHLQKLSTIAMAALLAALTVACTTAIIAVASQGTSSSKVCCETLAVLDIGFEWW